jgi:6-phosphogluconolactonase (cycloisomerase 2 family)
MLDAQAPENVRTTLYAAVGPELAHYGVDVDKASLEKIGGTVLPGNVQYAWPHPSKKYLYVAWSDGGPVGPSGPPAGGSRHGVNAFRIDPATGALHPHGRPATLASRPIHLTADISGAHVIVAHNDPSTLTVFRIGQDGSIGAPVKQPALDAGVYAHQVRVEPSGRIVFVVARGNGPARGKAEDPGALKIFSYKDGVLASRASVAPDGGIGFQPRHLDFHPARPWVFVSVERQNQLQVYKRLGDGTLSAAPLFTKSSLADGAQATLPGQAAGTVHVHPNGRFVYQANRASGVTEFEGKPVFAGGENTIAVFAIDQTTGEPKLIQSADTRGMAPRTFALDPGSRILVAGNQVPFLERRGSEVRAVPASLVVYRVRNDGTLDFVRKYDVEATNNRSLFWMGFAGLR